MVKQTIEALVKAHGRDKALLIAKETSEIAKSLVGKEVPGYSDELEKVEASGGKARTVTNNAGRVSNNAGFWTTVYNTMKKG